MKKSILFLAILLFTPSLFSKSSPQKKGLLIAKKIYQAGRGFLGGSDIVLLILKDGKGGRTTRNLLSFYKQVPKDGDRSLIIFKKPLDIKGTKLLTWSHKMVDDDQWLYLPSLKRVKRISNRGKSASFMGSEFSYEDLIAPELNKYTFRFLKTIKDRKGNKSWVVERVSKKKSSYSKVILTYSQNMMIITHASYYDRRGELLKKSILSKIKAFKYQKKKFHLPFLIIMKNFQTGKLSHFEFLKRKIGVKHSDFIFNKNKLK